jgi:hypothetical protein
MIVSVYNNISLDISKMCDRFCFRVKERSKKRKPSSIEIQSKSRRYRLSILGSDTISKKTK